MASRKKSVSDLLKELEEAKLREAEAAKKKAEALAPPYMATIGLLEKFGNRGEAETVKQMILAADKKKKAQAADDEARAKAKAEPQAKDEPGADTAAGKEQAMPQASETSQPKPPEESGPEVRAA